MPKVNLMFVTDVPTKILISYIFSSGVNIWPITDSVKILMHTLLCTLFSTREFIWQNLHFIIFIDLGLSRIFTTKHQLLLHFTSSCLCHVPTHYNESYTKRFKKYTSQIIVTTSLWIKKNFKLRRHKYRKHESLMKGNLCFISNKMEIKTENGESETTEARWKGQIWI
jgi:hypothetical protein